MGEWKDLNISSTDVDLNTRLTTLEEQYELVEYYYTVSAGTTGTVTIPTGYTIEMDRFTNGIDAIVAKEGTDGRPTDEAVYTSLGVIVSTTLAANGNYVFSGIPSGYNVCIVYYLKGKRKYRENLTFNNILGSSEYLVTPSQLDALKWTTAGVYTAPTYTNNNNGSVTIGTGEYVIYSNALTNPPVKYTITGGTYTCTDQINNYLVAEYNNGNPRVVLLPSRDTINQITVIPIYTIFRNGNVLVPIDWDTFSVALANKLNDRAVRTARFEVEPGGLGLGEAATRLVTIGQGYVWYAANRLFLNSFNSGSNDLIFYRHVGGVWTESIVSQYNNTQYDNGTDVVSTSGGKYVVNWIYRRASGTSIKSYFILGTGDYNLAQAQATLIPTNIPPEIMSTGILVGRIIVKQGDATATQIDSAFAAVLVAAPVNDHSQLTNLDYANAGHTGFQAALTNPVTGTGTTNKVSKFTGTSTIGNSNIEDTGTVVKIPVVTNIGDGGTTDYSQFEADGTLKFVGAATVFEDLNFNPLSASGVAATLPDYVTINNTTHREFTSLNNQLCGDAKELPHSYKLSAALYPHAHIFLKTGESAGTTGVTFTFYWELRQTTGTTSGSVALSATSATLSGNADKIDIYNGSFAGAAELGAQLSVTIARTAGNAGDVVLLTYGVHYEIDQVGSKELTSK